MSRHGLSVGLTMAFLALGCPKPEGPLSGEPGHQEPSPDLKAISPQQSAGVFIGVEEFSHLTDDQNVLYAVNDAVDLAYALSIERQLLPTHQVRLLLSGDPAEGSVKRLKELMATGAIKGVSTKAAIEGALKDQAALVGSEGVLYVFLATHGFSDGRQYFLAEDSLPGSHETAVSEETIIQTSQALSGGQTVLIQDTCRTEIPPAAPVRLANNPATGLRSVVPLPLAPGPELTGRRGYAVLFATGPRNIAGSDPGRRNGIFTGAILDGLQCSRPTTDPKVIPLAGLASFVQETVRKRSTGRQDPQLLTAEGFQDFPLVRCAPIGQILTPKAGKRVSHSGEVQARVDQPNYYATAVVQAMKNRVYYLQPPTRPTVAGSVLEFPVYYGAPDSFQVYVVVSADPDLFGDEEETDALPRLDGLGRAVYQLGPVPVVREK